MADTWHRYLRHLSSAMIGKNSRLAGKGLVVVVGAIVAAGMFTRKPVFHDAQPIKEIAAAPVRSVEAERVRLAGGLDAGLEHDRIAYWVHRITTSQGQDFALVLSKKSKYADMITAKLDARGMPRDLIYLAMIESEFNPTAKSSVKAVGLWQFMAGTARQLGLKVHGGTDELKDPELATDAALTYLSELHDRLGSWYLAAAAYNSGEGAVRKALYNTTGQVVGTDADFFRILPALPRETQDYVPKLIATARVAGLPEQYGLTIPSLPVLAPAVSSRVGAFGKESIARRLALAKRPALPAIGPRTPSAGDRIAQQR